MSEDNESLRRRLKEERANLRLIQERKSQFVLQTDIPLSLLKEERTKVALIAQLEAELKRDRGTTNSPAAKPDTAPNDLLNPSEPISVKQGGNRLYRTLRDQAWQRVAALIGLAALMVAVAAWLLPDIGWPPRKTPIPSATTSPTATFTPTLTTTPTPTATATSVTATPSPTQMPMPRSTPINDQTAARIALIQPPLIEEKGPVSAIAFTSDGNLYATGLTKGTNELWLWQVGPTTTPMTLTVKSYERAGVAFSRDGQKLAWSIGKGDQIAVWDTQEATAPVIVRPWAENDQRLVGAKVLSLAFSADGLTLACGTNKGAIALVGLADTDQQTALFYNDSQFVEVLSVAFSTGESSLDTSLATLLGWRVRRWTIHAMTGQDLPLQPAANPYAFSVRPVFNLAFSPDDRLLAAVLQPAGGVQLWTTDDWDPRPLFEGGEISHAESIMTSIFPDSFQTDVPRGDNVKFSPDASVVASWIRGNRVRLWRVSDGQKLVDTQPLSSGISSLAFSSDGGTLAAGTWDGRIYQWRVQ